MLELKNVRKVYTTKIGDVNALDDVSLTFPEKGLVFITGKSGSGKTTMLNVVGGLDGFDEGEIIIDGKSFSDLTAKDYDSYRNTFIGVVFQEYNLLPEYTVEKNIKIATELQGVVVDESELDRLMDLVGIKEFKTRLPSELSGGQMQRVAIARALIKNPHIILADEPTGALDSVTGIQVIETLKNLSKEKLVIIVSHDLELAEKYADRIITLRDGKIVDDVEVNDVTVEGNIYDGKVLCVKSGADLSLEEKDLVVDAVKNRRPIEVIDNITIREKSPTKPLVNTDKENKSIELINSKMKFKSAAELGVKSLKVKPFRLIITILLAVIAFGLFGVFDSVAAYNESKILFYNLKDSGFNSIVVDAEYTNSDGDGRSIKMSQAELDKINQQTNYNFKGITYINDIYDTSSNSSGEYTIAQVANYSTKVRQSYYSKRVNGVIEFEDKNLTTKMEKDADGNNVEVKYITENGFNFKILHGEYPSSFNEDGSVRRGDVRNVGISKHLAESLLVFAGSEKYGDVKLNRIEDLVGAPLTLKSTTYTITCIIDCGEIPERYNPLKGADELDNEYAALAKEYKSFLGSSAYLNLFMDAGVFDYNKSLFNRVNSYYAPDAATSFKVESIATPFTISKTTSQWFAVEDIPTSNYITFDYVESKDDKGKTVYNNVPIRENEVLINATKLIPLFATEYGVIGNTDKVNGFKTQDLMQSYGNIIKDELNPNGVKYAFEDKRDAMNAFIKIMEDFTAPSLTGSLLGQNITSKNVQLTQTFSDSGLKKVNNLKVVGVYFNIEKNDATPTNWIFALRKADLSKVGVYDGQGFYIRAISPVNINSDSRELLANMMTKDTGLQLTWYKNTTISGLTDNAFKVKEMFEIFIYVDIVLAFFAVFMLSNYISTSIIQKRQTIGILRALGSNGRDIFRMFIIESLVIAVLSGIFAIVFGLIGCHLVNFYINTYMSINVNFAIFEFRQGLLIFLSTVITSLVASLIPIIRTCKRKPVELIRKSL
ncbi:MAG: ATP-binding cassette domain-containing protein [Clostridia bacterium]|nr:ATP-binding cassette domain-containing protein [Clostridia bacterium]